MMRNDGRINVMYCAGFCTSRRRRRDDVCGLAGVVLLPLNSINNRKNNQLTVRSLIEDNDDKLYSPYNGSIMTIFIHRNIKPVANKRKREKKT